MCILCLKMKIVQRLLSAIKIIQRPLSARMHFINATKIYLKILTVAACSKRGICREKSKGKLTCPFLLSPVLFSFFLASTTWSLLDLRWTCNNFCSVIITTVNQKHAAHCQREVLSLLSICEWPWKQMQQRPAGSLKRSQIRTASWSRAPAGLWPSILASTSGSDFHCLSQ